MARTKFTPQTKALEAAKREVMEAFTQRDEETTATRLTAFFAQAGAETNQGMQSLLQVAYLQEDARLFGKIMDDCIAKHKTNGGRKFQLGASDPG